MELPYKLHPAQPLAVESLHRHLEAPLIRADACREDGPSFAQSLTRLQHLRRQLFRGEDWDELAWLIAEGDHLEKRRLRKHPLFKIGPRRQLQRRIQHLHGRATIKTIALTDAIETPLRDLVIKRGKLQPSESTPPRIPWRKFTPPHPDTFGAPSIVESAALLAENTPLLHYLINLTCPLTAETNRIQEAWEHAQWHAREVAALNALPTPWYQRGARQSALNRLLRIALEHSQQVLLQLRELHLNAASGLKTTDLERSLES